jgi:hypothetical protein
VAAYEVLLLNTAIPQIQAAQAGDTYVVPRDIAFSAALTLSAGTANGVPYLNGSKVLTTGSALTFDGTKLVATATTGAATTYPAYFDNSGGGVGTGARIGFRNTAVSYGEIGYLYDGVFATIIDSAGSNNTRFLIAGTEQARLTSSGLEIKQSQLIGYSSYAGIGTNGLAVAGNVGVGAASPNAKLDVVKAGGPAFRTYFGSGNNVSFDVNVDTANGDARLTWNTTNTGGTYTYFQSNASSMLRGDGGFKFFIAPVGTAGDVISFTQAMTLDASGNLGVGATSPSTFNQNQLYGAVIGNGTSLPGLTLYGGTTSGGSLNFADGTSGTDQYRGSVEYNHSSDFMAFRTASTERARITSGGDLLVGTNTALNGTARLDVNALTGNNVAATLKNDAGANQWAAQVWNAGTSGDNSFIQFATETAYTGRGSITYNRGGGLVAYNTTSDYRAKDVTGPVANSGATIDALKVYNGKIKGATVERPMLIAHEAQEVTPYAVTGEKDAVEEDGKPKYQQMDVSSLVPLLIAEIQSLRARVAQLEQGV